MYTLLITAALLGLIPPRTPQVGASKVYYVDTWNPPVFAFPLPKPTFEARGFADGGVQGLEVRLGVELHRVIFYGYAYPTRPIILETEAGKAWRKKQVDVRHRQ